MNEATEDLTQDEEIAAPLSVVEKPKSNFSRPPDSFRGMELHAYSYSYEDLFNQVIDAQDKGLWAWEAFVFMLLKRTPEETWREHRDWIRKLAWEVDKFRDALLDWKDANGPFSVEDKIEMRRIYEDTMKAVAETTVQTVPDRKRTMQKKTCRRMKHSSSTSSEGS